ncbi:MAG: vanadium-dependent haloperoxidase [Gemmatimonadota bacterium]
MKGTVDRRWAAHLAILLTLALAAGCADPGPAGLPDSTSEASPVTGPATEAAGAETYDAAVPLAWFDLSFDLTRDEGLFPPPAARAYAYASVTLWEAVAPGVPGGRSLAGQLNGLADMPTPRHELHWPTVANAALAGIMQRFYTDPASRRAIRELEHEFHDRFRSEISGRLFGHSVAHGQRVAMAIWQWSRSDGYREFNDCAYTAPVGPGLWSPTPPGFLDPVQPCWGSLRPFVLSAATACEPGPHPPYSEDPASEFYQQALEVYETVNNATPEQRTIALFWADLDGESGTPAGHSLSITAQALDQVDASLDLAAEAFARVGIGESDAFISCWAGKFHYNVLRPVTYINALIDPEWESILVTPPFPAYASGHSNDAGTASAIMTALFGDGFAFTDHTNDDRGFAPRSFGSFFEAAEESAFSRLYGGIHYRFDIENGINQGRCVAEAVNALEFRVEP